MQESEHKAFSRPIEASSVTARAVERVVEPNAEERRALADFLDLQSLDSLQARLSLRRLASGLIEVKGELDAALVQTCVVTLEPVPAEVHERFRWTFGDAVPEPLLSEIDVDFEDTDPPEPIENGIIDLGEIVTEELSLGLDPYPRKAGAEVSQEYQPKSDEPVAERRNPFQDLDKLRK